MKDTDPLEYLNIDPSLVDKISERILAILEDKDGLNELAQTKPEDFYKSTLKRIMSGIPDVFYTKRVTRSNPAFFDMSFWRVSQYNGLNPYLISSFSHPSASQTVLGRCNIPKYPVLYLSDHFTSAINEFIASLFVRPKSVFLSEWKFSADVEELCFTPFYRTGKKSTHLGRIISTSLDNFFTKHCANHAPILKSIIEKFQDIIHTENGHLVSSVISHKFIYGMTGFSPTIFGYESFACKEKALNFAFHPNMIGPVLQLKHVDEIKINNASVEPRIGSNITPIRIAPVINGHIQWRDFNLDDQASGDRVNYLQRKSSIILSP